jgi:hypothetical protein
VYEIKEFKSITLLFIFQFVHEVDQNGMNGVNKFSRMIEVGGTELETILGPEG